LKGRRKRRHCNKRARATRRSKGSEVFLPRLVNQGMPFHQSQNRMAVFTDMNRNRNKSTRKNIYQLMAYDWFHVLLRVHIVVACLMLILVWTMMLLFFAYLYIKADGLGKNLNQDCGLGIEGKAITFPAAFAFAMETATSVGYGLPSSSNAFFEKGCGHIQILIYFQMIFNMMFNAFMIAFFYSQLSKSEKRSIQLVFSKKIIIGVNNNNNNITTTTKKNQDQEVYASVRCYDLDSSHPLVEAHARMYLVDHTLKLIPLRITDPDDEAHNGAMMLPSIPTEIIHQIDIHSALSPPQQQQQCDHRETNSTKRGGGGGGSGSGSGGSGGTVQRSIDSSIGSREEITCPICGAIFGSYAQLKLHVEWNTIMEQQQKEKGSSTSSTQSQSQHKLFAMPSIVDNNGITTTKPTSFSSSLSVRTLAIIAVTITIIFKTVVEGTTFIFIFIININVVIICNSIMKFLHIDRNFLTIIIISRGRRRHYCHTMFKICPKFNIIIIITLYCLECTG